MIKDYVARAMQVSMLEQDQLERIHLIENAAHFILPNWNIQSLFDLPEIKDRYDIPEADDQQINHHRRIEKELTDKKLIQTGKFYEDKIEMTHAQDWNVWNAKDQILWDYAGSRKTNLKEMLRGSLALLLMAVMR